LADTPAARPPSRSRVADALRPLASRPYRLMWLGSGVSSLGDALVQIALVFAILHIGGTASDIGIVAAVQTVARVAFLLPGGVWADRLRRQYVMLAADAVRAAVQATLAALLLSGHAHVWELGVGAALYGAATSFFGPASTALVAAWGVISGSWGVGAIVAGVVGLRVRPRRPPVVADLLAVGLALPILALALSRSVAVIAAADAMFGFTLVVSNSVWNSTIQALIPDKVRARVDSYDWLVSLVIMPVGYVVAGPLSSSAGFTSTLVAAAAIGAIPCALVILVPGVRGVHRIPGGEILGPGDPARPDARPAVGDVG
jgi:Transmembrane secretion effector